MATPQAVLEDLKGVFEEKNDDYGNSWEKVGVLKRVMADEDGPEIIELDEGNKQGVVVTGPNEGDVVVSFTMDPDEFDDGVELVKLADTPTATSTFQQNVEDTVTRMLDKLCRAYTLTLQKDEPALENESTLDAWEDLTGYAAMITSLVSTEADDE